MKIRKTILFSESQGENAKMQLKYQGFISTIYSNLCPDGVVAYHLALSKNLKWGFAKRPGPGFKSFTSHNIFTMALKSESPGQGVIKKMPKFGPVAQLGRAPAF